VERRRLRLVPDAAVLRAAQAGISTLVERDLTQFWGALDLGRPEFARDALLEFVPVLVDTYGSAAASVAADWYDEARALEVTGGGFRAIAAAPVDPEVMRAQVRFGAQHLFTDDPLQTLAFLTGSAQKYAIAPSRETVATSAIRDPKARGWSRVTRHGSCDFCTMLAGRGHVYTEATVGFEAHGHCNCAASPAWH